jgi:hypothetical protein
MTGDRSEPFASADEAVAALAVFAEGFSVPCVDRSPTEIARESVDSAWARAIARKNPGAAEAYADWASEAVPRMVKSARYVINQEQFDILVRRTGTDLLRSWRGSFPDRRAKLSFGAAFRAVDLLFKGINESESCRFGSIQAFLHAPLDGATLRPLRLCIDELVDRDFSVEIPAAVPAGFVATEEQYVLLQEAIVSLSDRAGVAPIVYAYFCVNLSPS